MQPCYIPADVETQAQAYWDQHQLFRAVADATKEKFYCLSMFPYPSGRLHMGHVRNYTLGDVISRYQRMCGKNVLQPIGWDAFGLPAENAAIKHGVAPAQWTEQNIDYMRTQLKRLGFAYDWQRELATCQPQYYRWEQWFFTQLVKAGLAYRKQASVNWCPHDQTVLANEQVHDGLCWRCDTPVQRRQIEQWFIKTTDYAQELLQKLDELPGWPEKVKEMQRNWLGRSEGVVVEFALQGQATAVEVYTTRPDTLMGVTYLAIAAQHPLAVQQGQHNEAIAQFIQSCQHSSTAEAELAKLDKRGIDTGLTALHPISGETLPIWIANFVLMDYGSGAVMSVPAHDQRDWEFAQAYALPVRQVIRAVDASVRVDIQTQAFSDKGVLINSGQWDGLTSQQAFAAIAKQLQHLGKGRQQTQYRLRDWGVSRQRYWGAPIPMVTVAGQLKPAESFPVELPLDVVFNGADSPLNDHPDFTQVDYQGQVGRRETDTFDTFMESSWYYARFCSPQYSQGMLDPDEANYWLPVDHYVGGIEHATMHLIYARFFHKAMRDQGLVNSDEPFERLLCQGMVLAETYYRDTPDGRQWLSADQVVFTKAAKGRVLSAIERDSGEPVVMDGMKKMSKSKNNGVDPQQAIEQYGADTLRLFALFAAPPEQTLEWVDSGVQGAAKFLQRLWRAVYQLHRLPVKAVAAEVFDEQQQALYRKIHQTLAKVTDDFARRYQYNTAIAAIMELFNHSQKLALDSEASIYLVCEALRVSVLMLSPITPHICHALWQALGYDTVVANQPWPQVDETALVREHWQYIVQVNGKLRGRIDVDAQMDDEQIQALALADDNVARFVQDRPIRKVIVVRDKLVNIVV